MLLKEVYSCALLLIVLDAVCAQDCSALLSSGGKRFILDDVYNAWNKLPKEVKSVLPVNTEVSANCRFDLTSMSDSNKQLLKTLYDQGYAICVGCGYTDADHGRCHSIDVCRKGSSCIQARNQNRNPDYYWHGCCDPADVNCRSGDDVLHFNVFGRDVTTHYIKTACTGPICNENGYTNQKDQLISFLTGNAPPAPQTTAPTTRAAQIDGGWTDWSAWSSCDKSCDIGLKSRVRSCTNPVPQNGGKYCDGIDSQSEFCNVIPCS